MKTLRKNKPAYGNAIWHKVVKCTGRGPIVNIVKPCGSILELKASDIRCAIIPGAYMTDDNVYGFICKECGCFTKVNALSIPRYIKNQAEKLAKEERK